MELGGAVGAVAEGSAISLPKGGGAVCGAGGSFSADAQTGAGGFKLPITLPPGRNGQAPPLTLSYSTGGGNGEFGLGWSVGLPAVARKTSRGVPRYGAGDTFVLSGEDLIFLGTGSGADDYRPRTEGAFARIRHVHDAGGDFWEARTREGTVTRYEAATVRPGGGVFSWQVTQTLDPLGNQVRYSYGRDGGRVDGHEWDQPLIDRIEYADYGPRDDPSFLVAVEFDYEARPDPFSDYRAGFEIRTTKRCRLIRVSTRTSDGVVRIVREYRFSYEQAPFNGVSLLARLDVVGVDGDDEESLPPLTFTYSSFDPARRRFEPVTGELPAGLGDPNLALVDLRGNGLPDLVEVGGAHRYWTNRGGGRFDRPRVMAQAPPHALGDGGVMLLDADGDGRTDLLAGGGYFPLAFDGRWSAGSFRPYRQMPSVDLADPAVKLIDLDGDGLTDILRTGATAQCWFNDADPRLAWRRHVRATAPDISLNDPHVRLADMTGDGLLDIVSLRDGNVSYWPNLGHGRWGTPVMMRSSPRFGRDFDPRRVLLGDVDGDGAADLVYLGDGRILLWGNRSGNEFAPSPVVVPGVPAMSNVDNIQLADVHGTGMGGLLFSRATARDVRFLDLCGGIKPYLLSNVDTGTGARTSIEYRPSTAFFLADQARWRTTLPFPLHVVASVTVVDQITATRLVTEYRYHHGYWDGVEREFRGFGMVEQFDSETVGSVPAPPILVRRWFHLGPVAAIEAEDWTELDLADTYWAGDPSLLPRSASQALFLNGLSRKDRRDALRAMRGQELRSEVYGLDDPARPYTVTETQLGVRQVGPGIFFPFPVATRTSQWERGDEPLTQFSFTAGYDAYGLPGKQLGIAVPREEGEPYLATLAVTEYARRDDPQVYLVDRVSRVTSFEVRNDGSMNVFDLRDAVLAGGGELRVIGHARTFYDGPAFTGLPLGELGLHGLPVRTETLAFPDDFLDEVPPYLRPSGAASWPDEYPPEFRSLTPGLLGYAHHADGEVPGYYVVGTRMRYDVHDPALVPRGRLLETRDAFGAASTVDYDQYELLPVRSVDALGLSTTAVVDYRVLSPSAVSDTNGNTVSVTFSPLGMVTAKFVRGKGGGLGDAVVPSTRIDYDLLAFVARGQPMSVRTAQRVHHDTQTEVPLPQRDETIVSVEYSDGMGRSLQTRTQAEQENAVVVSGWQIRDNKGRVVQKYEPFFATGFDYRVPDAPQLGQKTTLFYDPRGQLIRTVNPDGSEQRTIYGVPVSIEDPEVFVPTPWEFYVYDANDNAGRTHREQALSYAGHWNTPTSVVADALGRGVVSVARNGSEHVVTKTAHDIQGNVVSVTDPLGREAFRYTHDLLKRRWRTQSIDGGFGLAVLDGLGHAVEARDGKGALVLTAYDRMRRPIRQWARDNGSEPVTLRQHIEYGDGGDPGQPAPERDVARQHNLLGRAVRHFDEAGLATVSDVDFKGNVLETSRRVIADAVILSAFQGAEENGWEVKPFRTDWQTAAGQTLAERAAQLLAGEAYLTSTRYDALSRITRLLLPSDVDGQRRELRPRFNRAGLMERVLLDGAAYVQRIAHDALGRRTVIEYGNGVVTRYAYNAVTFRLVRVVSSRNGMVLQDCGYEYDLAGNVLAVRERTPGCGLPVTPDALDRLFSYDPLYRLETATGRESDLAPADPPWAEGPRGNDITRTRRYTEAYSYDANGNLTRLVHSSAVGYTRAYTVDSGSNRLQRLTIGTTPFEYSYDANGNLLTETRSRRFGWDHSDRLRTFATQTPGAEPSLHTHYLYDAAGQRTVKLVRRQGGSFEVFHYLDGFEHHRWGTGQNTQIHVMDDKTRIALARIGPAGPGDQTPAVAFQLADHLGSSVAVIDATGTVTNREEYTPYGETSFGSYARKRYRYTGKERDEESGLGYHSNRYYLSWLGRWAGTDPIEVDGGLNQYAYTGGNPLTYNDPSGCGSSLALSPYDLDRSGRLDSREVSEALLCTKNEGSAHMALADRLQSFSADDYTPDGQMLAACIIATYDPAYHVQTEAEREYGYTHNRSTQMQYIPGFGPTAITYTDQERDAWADRLAHPSRQKAESLVTTTKVAVSVFYPEVYAAISLLTAENGDDAAEALLSLGLARMLRVPGKGLTAEQTISAAAGDSSALGAMARGSVTKTVTLGAADDLSFAGALHGQKLPGRPNAEIMIRTAKEKNAEVAVVYMTGPGRNGGGGQYWVFLGEKDRITIPSGSDVRLIFHTHPGGTAYASAADRLAMDSLAAMGSPQRSSIIVLPDGRFVRFGGTLPRLPRR